jgi:hypothetical protein
LGTPDKARAWNCGYTANTDWVFFEKDQLSFNMRQASDYPRPCRVSWLPAEMVFQPSYWWQYIYMLVIMGFGNNSVWNNATLKLQGSTVSKETEKLHKVTENRCRVIICMKEHISVNRSAGSCRVLLKGGKRTQFHVSTCLRRP